MLHPRRRYRKHRIVQKGECECEVCIRQETKENQTDIVRTNSELENEEVAAEEKSSPESEGRVV